MARAKGRNRPASRPTVQLSATLDKGLLGYASAAAAAGVGVLALTQSAQAKVVFTPSHILIPDDASVSIDLNHDGVADFSFSFFSNTSRRAAVRPPRAGIRHRGDARPPASIGVFQLTAWPAQPGNAIGAITSFTGDLCAAELQPGRLVSTYKNFATGHLQMNRFVFTFSGVGTYQGPWQENKGGYLGLKFMINGEIHYGWAHISVPGYVFLQESYITGYAYDDEPNTPIYTGNRGDAEPPKPPLRPQSFDPPAQAPTPQPATLGHLAAGAAAVPLWRSSVNE
jgi:hypothetical protein